MERRRDRVSGFCCGYGPVGGVAGFAFDSFIEIFASIIVVWQLKGTEPRHDEARAVRLIGLAFFLLAIYIAIQTVATLALGIRPDPSPLGIAWLVATCVVMFSFATGKAHTGRELDHPVSFERPR